MTLETTPTTPEQLGICCPKCGCADLRVTRTMRVRRGIRRYRTCRHCGWRMVSNEKLPRDEHRQ